MGLPNIGPVELIIILVIALLVLGPGKLPEVGAAFGKTIREFRKASTEVQEATTAVTKPLSAPAAAPAPAPAPESVPSDAPMGTPADPATDRA